MLTLILSVLSRRTAGLNIFSKFSRSENTQDKGSTTKHIINGFDPVLDSPFTAEEIYNGIKQLKNNKASSQRYHQ